MSEFIEDQFHYNVEELPEMLLVNYSFEPEKDGWTNLSFDIYLGDVRMNRFLDEHAIFLISDIEKEVERRCDNDVVEMKEDNKSIAIDNAYANREI